MSPLGSTYQTTRPAVIYLAAPFSERVPLMQGWRRDLQMRGHTVVSRWIDEKDEKVEDSIFGATRDIVDLDLCEVLIQHNSTERRNTRGANHSELGYALALGRRCIVVGVAGNIFHNLCEVYPTWMGCLEALN